MKKHATLLILLFAWAVIFGVFAFLVPLSFPTQANIETIARQTAIVGFAAIGMTYIIIRGAIDLSVGSTVAFVTVVIAWMLQVKHTDGLTAALAGVLTGCLCGLANGLMVTGFRVSPFIATLGSLLVIRGAAKGLGNEQKIDVDKCPAWLQNVLAKLAPDQRWQLFPPGVWLLLVVAVLAAWFLRSSVFGRNVVAAGSNEDASYLAGLPVRRDLVLVFVLGGLFTGLAGLMQFSRLTVGDPTVAVGLELDVIAAVVIGGASLTGGQGSIAGSLIGALIMTTIKSGANQIGMPNWVQEIATGMIIVTAVTIDRLRAARA
ncbi:MAG: ABC transporter permease [Armatimonadetes bacterium]|nr:ABC transporter permease [Armatimonadota bacterium]